MCDPVRTAAPVPTTWPLVVASGQRLQHPLRWRDEATPDNRAKPPAVRGAEIWCAVGPTRPANPAQYRFLALDTEAPHLVEHATADAGQTAHYLVRRVNTRGQPGPWSETGRATKWRVGSEQDEHALDYGKPQSDEPACCRPTPAANEETYVNAKDFIPE